MTPARLAMLITLVASLAPATVTAQESPIDFLRRLVTPPVQPPTTVFRRDTQVAPPPEIVPLPKRRPNEDGGPAKAVAPTIAAAPATPGPTAAQELAEEIEDFATAPLAFVPIPALRPENPLALPPPAARSICGRALEMLGVRAVPMEPVADGRCGIAAPVAVSAVGGGDIALTETAVIECATAERLETWLNDHVRPAARRILGGDLTGIRVAASYACRNRNSLDDTRLSEHARGNAIDISAFEVSGEGWLAVGTEDGRRQQFLSEVRKSACGPFKTVLGPGADAYHSDHFHLDLAKRRSGGTYCR